jgi:Bacteriophage HK97-gp10, putative tail-component
VKLKIQLKDVEKSFRKLTRDSDAERMLKSEIQVQRMVADLRDATPVDTGEARDSWSVSRNGFSWDVINTADHIKYLNEGSSQQAPAHFVEAIALRYGRPLGTIVDVKD